MSKVVYPIDIGIRKFYRMYVTVEEGTPEGEIRQTAIEKVLVEQDDALIEDHDLDIECGDIVLVDIDHDGVMTDEEIEGIEGILRRMKQ